MRAITLSLILAILTTNSGFCDEFSQEQHVLMPSSTGSDTQDVIDQKNEVQEVIQKQAAISSEVRTEESQPKSENAAPQEAATEADSATNLTPAFTLNQPDTNAPDETTGHEANNPEDQPISPEFAPDLEGLKKRMQEINKEIDNLQDSYGILKTQINILKQTDIPEAQKKSDDSADVLSTLEKAENEALVKYAKAQEDYDWYHSLWGSLAAPFVAPHQNFNGMDERAAKVALDKAKAEYLDAVKMAIRYRPTHYFWVAELERVKEELTEKGQTMSQNELDQDDLATELNNLRKKFADLQNN